MAIACRQGECHPCQPRSQSLQLVRKLQHKGMTIARGHQLQCFAGLGKQPLRGTTPIKDCANEEAVARLECGGERHRNNKCGCKQLGDSPPPGRRHNTPPFWLPRMVKGSLGGVHSSNGSDSSILKSLFSNTQGPGETGETETYPSMVLVPSLYKIG